MGDDMYITPHEAALAVVATAMKKARLRLDTLIINSIIGGLLFSAGGMLHLLAQAENPGLWDTNPGVVHFQQGAVYAIGLFYVIMMGAELFNSNILYFSVGVCRGAVTIVDLLISWGVSWLFNLAANLFVCYVICNLSGVTKQDLYVKGSIQIVEDKMACSFIETFIKGIAGNFCVCLAVYLQLLAKPIHVKLIVMAIPIFTFVSMGFTHTVADMYLVPMGLINGAPYSVGHWIWKGLIPATLGNAVGGSFFGIVVPWYLHLVTVERDRKLLNLPEFEARDEQPELEMDSRVVRVKSASSPEKSIEHSDDSSKSGIDFNPITYRPEEVNPLTVVDSALSRYTTTSSARRANLRSPPGVFPVMGMGKPFTKEASIAGSTEGAEYPGDDDASIDSYASSGRATNDMTSLRSRRSFKPSQKEEVEEYVSNGGYNARDNTLGESLKRVVTNKKTPQKAPNDIEMGMDTFDTSSRRASVGSKLMRTFTAMTNRQPNTTDGINEHINKHRITMRALSASDNIAGIDGYTSEDLIARPSPVRRSSSQSVAFADVQPERSSATTQTRAGQLEAIRSGDNSPASSEEDDINGNDEPKTFK